MANSAREGNRFMKLQEEREKRKEEFEKKKAQIHQEHVVAAAKITEKFAAKTDNIQKLVAETTGLQTYEQFAKKREEVERQAKVEERRALDAEKEIKRKKEVTKSKLSFDVEGDEEEGDGSGDGSGSDSEPSKKKAKFGKNPLVDTSFLPDREREDAERKQREQLRHEWLEQQTKAKQEPIEITYSYWDGRGHRRTTKCIKGNTIATFLEKVRQEFPELKGVSCDNMMYIKEDLIIPHHFTFHDLIVMKARGKSGPLFDFGVHDDVRVLSDASKEKQEAHAGKVVERRWYERNKHIFPASRWEVFEPGKDYGAYTIHDTKKEKEEKENGKK